MENGGKKITKIKLYSCGYCKNNLGIVFHRHKKDIRQFPALVVYLHHEKFGNMRIIFTPDEEMIDNIAHFLKGNVRAELKRQDFLKKRDT